MSARGHSTDRSSTYSSTAASGSTVRSRHQYSSPLRAHEANQKLNDLANAASSNSFYDSRSSVVETPHLSVVDSSPFFCPQRPPYGKRYESELDLELRTNAGSSTRAGSISEDDDFFTPTAEFLPIPPTGKAVESRPAVSAAAPVARPKTPTLDPAEIKEPPLESLLHYRPTSSSQVNDPPSNSTFRDGGSSFCTSSQRSGHSAQTYLRSLAETARSQRKLLEKEQQAAASEIASVVSQGTSPSIPAVSDSYIHRNDYVTKPRWGLSAEELAKNAQQNLNHSAEFTPDAEQIRKQHIARNPYVRNSMMIPHASKMSNVDTQTLDTTDSRVSAFVTSTLGHHMDKLSMDKVFNDPSFRGICSQYNKETKKPPTTVRSAPSVRKSLAPRTVARSELESKNSDRSVVPSKTPPRQMMTKFDPDAICDQIPASLAILDAEILSLLTADVLKSNPLLAKLHSACFRPRTNGSVECLSMMDLGLEKKDHEFLTANWMQLAHMTECCQQVYSLISLSGCADGQFLQNIMAFLRHAVAQGLELAILLVRTATFVVVRDGDPVDLLNYVHHLRQLSEALSSNTEFIETVRVALNENFAAIPMVVSGIRLDAAASSLFDLSSNKNTGNMCPAVVSTHKIVRSCSRLTQRTNTRQCRR
ncbi:uncharacterized protein LOC129590394 [Paramacrobiotus metropolitanus]|uniref:uncharacterized protein LOC129590394 n=1 Tax=Paramacrobiotus metropolitanus TaxID=2943436 RepID=UPI002445663E|nr:uncharacterized protein LOC129590394 [Paramacrobiotus metropolitanus]